MLLIIERVNGTIYLYIYLLHISSPYNQLLECVWYMYIDLYGCTYTLYANDGNNLMYSIKRKNP